MGNKTSALPTGGPNYLFYPSTAAIEEDKQLIANPKVVDGNQVYDIYACASRTVALLHLLNLVQLEELQRKVTPEVTLSARGGQMVLTEHKAGAIEAACRDKTFYMYMLSSEGFVSQTTSKRGYWFMRRSVQPLRVNILRSEVITNAFERLQQDGSLVIVSP